MAFGWKRRKKGTRKRSPSPKRGRIGLRKRGRTRKGKKKENGRKVFEGEVQKVPASGALTAGMQPEGREQFF